MPDGKVILPMKHVVKATIKCRYHWKQARYEVSWVPSDSLLIVTCLECPKGEELARFKAAKE